MSAHARVSVVIAAYADERLPLLAQALDSLFEQTVEPLETIVVVDHNDRLLGALLAEDRPGVRVLANEQPQGASGARNTGVAAATGDVVAFLDDDARATSRWIEELWRAMEDPAVLGAGGAITPDWEAGRPRWFPPEFDWVVGCTYRGVPETTEPVRNLIAANMAMRRDAFVELGGFRQDFGKRGTRSEPEETELCLRASERWPERRWLHHPPAAVVHHVPPGRGRWGYFVERCWNEGLGKAALRRHASAAAALASERQYVREVLPLGIGRGLADALRGDPAGLLRAAAIALGLGVTALGYARGRLSR